MACFPVSVFLLATKVKSVRHIAKEKAGATEMMKTNYVFDVEFFIDGKAAGVAKLPVDFTTRRYDVFWKYQLPQGTHSFKVKVLNPAPGYTIRLDDALIYSDKK